MLGTEQTLLHPQHIGDKKPVPRVMKQASLGRADCLPAPDLLLIFIAQVQISNLSLFGCVTLCKLHNLSGPQFSHL